MFGWNRIFVIVTAVLFVWSAPSIGSEGQSADELSDKYLMSMAAPDPDADIYISEDELQSIRSFFHAAERAIEAEDLAGLMELYSDKYTNLKNGDKEFAKGIWMQIFSGFDNLSSRHVMKLIMYDAGQGQLVTECSGLITGTPVGENRTVTIDSWDAQRHILLKEDGWKLFGNAGKSGQRFGLEGGEIHPLF